MVRLVGLIMAVAMCGLAVGSAQEAESVKIKDVVGGDGSTCVLFTDGKVKCWGYGILGEHGRDDAYTVQIGDLPNSMGANLKYVSLGTDVKASTICKQWGHTCVTLTDGKVKCWGQNDAAQLGVGKKGENVGVKPGQMGDSLPSVLLPGLARKVTCGRYGNCALLEDGTVYCWGSDVKPGGHAPMTTGSVALGEGIKAVDISAGDGHTCALLAGGHVKCWGANDSGQLGQGDNRGRFSDTSLVDFGDKLRPVNLGNNRLAVQISAGASFNCALLDDGSTKCWGQNGSGQLGVGDKANRGVLPAQMGDALKAVDLGDGLTADTLSCSRNFCCASVASLGQVKCWGSNIRGAPDSIQIGVEPGQMGDFNEFMDFGRFAVVKRMGHGWQHSCVVLTDDRLFCYGRNSFAELGIEKKSPHSSLKLGDYLEETHVR